MQLSTSVSNRSSVSRNFLQMATGALAILLIIAVAALFQIAGSAVAVLQPATALVIAVIGAVALNFDASPLQHSRG